MDPYKRLQCLRIIAWVGLILGLWGHTACPLCYQSDIWFFNTNFRRVWNWMFTFAPCVCEIKSLSRTGTSCQNFPFGSEATCISFVMLLHKKVILNFQSHDSGKFFENPIIILIIYTFSYSSGGFSYSAGNFL